MRTNTFETPGPVALNLELPIGEIEIETDKGATTTSVELSGSGGAAEQMVEDARIESRDRADGQEITVEVRSQRSWFISFDRETITLRIRCPEGADLDVRTKSADIRVRGSLGDVSAKTASGDLNFDEVSGEVRIKTASGDVHVEDVHGSTSIQTASGDLFISRARGEVSGQLVSGDVFIRDALSAVGLNTVSGDQRIEAVVAGSVDLHAVSGDILVGVRRGSRVYVDCNTISGSTRSELELSDAPVAQIEAEAPLVEVRAKTVSGDIAITRAPSPAPLPSAS